MMKSETFDEEFEKGVRRILSREGLKYRIVDTLPLTNSFHVEVPIKLSKHRVIHGEWVSEPAAYALAKHATAQGLTHLLVTIQKPNNKLAIIWATEYLPNIEPNLVI